MTTKSQAISGATMESVAELVEEFCQRVQAGENLDAGTFAAEHPLCALALAEVLPAVEALAAFGELDSTPALLAMGDEIPESRILGDYLIKREVGRGGMGIVFEAEQASLGRRVALKILPCGAARDPKHLARFHVEAQAVATLNHPNIVPVFAVGSDRGVPYYAMQFIEGRSLAQIIIDLRQEQARTGGRSPSLGSLPAARLGLQAAEAIHHAHSMGVLHRDIKPANMLVDSRTHLWIVDFGLARIQTESGVTLSGDVLGTLRYMSPEQASGRGVLDPRSDVYSLGATLYELLVLRPAFQGRDRQDLLRQIASEEPIGLRKLDPGIPRDLETIILKAIAKEPEGRYESAGALAEDLRRFLDERPILGRRPRPHERVGRWMKRHKAAVAATAGGLVLAVAGLVTGNVILWNEKSRTRENLEAALHAIDRHHVYLGEEGLSTNPEKAQAILDELRADLGLYESLIRQNPQSRQVRSRAARAYRRVGDIQSRQATMINEAENAYRSADRFISDLIHVDATNIEYRDERAELLSHLGKHIYMLGGQRVFRGSLAAEGPLTEALSVDERLMAEFPRNSGYLRRFVQNSLYLSGVLFVADRHDELEHVLGRAQGILQGLDRGSPEACLDLAALHKLFGDIMHATDRGDEGDAAYDRSIVLLDSLATAHIDKQITRHSLVGFFGRLGQHSFCSSRQPQKQTAFYARALPLWERLVADIDLTPEEFYLRAYAHGYVGYLLLRDHSDRSAVEPLARAVELFEQLFRSHTSVPRYRDQLAHNCCELGRLLLAEGRPEEALPHLERSIELRPDSLRLKSDNLWYLTIYPHRLNGRAVELAEQLVAGEPENVECQSRLGAARARAGDFVGAQESLERVVRAATGGDTDDWLFLAMTCWHRGDEFAARHWYGKATTTINQRAGGEHPAVERLRNEVAVLIGATLPEPGTTATQTPVAVGQSRGAPAYLSRSRNR